MEDKCSTYTASLNAPASDAKAITPDDLAELPWVTRALYVGSPGRVKVVMESGEMVDFTELQAGIVYPLRIRRVLAVGTDAANLVALR